MVNFKEIYHLSRFQRGSNIFHGGGGSNFFQGGGSNCLFPIETHITCDFSGGGGGGGGGVWTPCPPSGSALVVPVDKHASVKKITPPHDPLGRVKGQIFKFCNNWANQYFLTKFCMQVEKQ